MVRLHSAHFAIFDFKVTVRCTLHELPRLLFLRRFKDSQISIKNADPYVIHENGTLEINVAQPLNSGKYTCIAGNNLGIKENHVFLEVKGQYSLITTHIVISVVQAVTQWPWEWVIFSVLQSPLVSWSSQSTRWCREEWALCSSVESNTTLPSFPPWLGSKTKESCLMTRGAANLEIALTLFTF